MMLLMWGFMVLLTLSVMFLFWLHFRKEQHTHVQVQVEQQLEEKVYLLEGNLKRTLEIMQELVKNVHNEGEILNQTVLKINMLEAQHAELVQLFNQYLALRQNHPDQ